MEDWKKDRTFKAEPGQEVSEEVYYDMLNGVPPHFWQLGYLQVGEPYDMLIIKNKCLNLYATFNGLEFVGNVPSMADYGIKDALKMFAIINK